MSEFLSSEELGIKNDTFMSRFERNLALESRPERTRAVGPLPAILGAACASLLIWFVQPLWLNSASEWGISPSWIWLSGAALVAAALYAWPLLQAEL